MVDNARQVLAQRLKQLSRSMPVCRIRSLIAFSPSADSSFCGEMGWLRPRPTHERAISPWPRSSRRARCYPRRGAARVGGGEPPPKIVRNTPARPPGCSSFDASRSSARWWFWSAGIAWWSNASSTMPAFAVTICRQRAHNSGDDAMGLIDVLNGMQNGPRGEPVRWPDRWR